MMLIWLIPVFIFIFIFLVQYFLFGFKKLPPGPNTFQLVRKLSSFPNKPHVAFNDLAKIYGPLMSFRLGGQCVIVVSSPSTAMEIFKTNNRVLCGRFIPSIYNRIPGMHVSLVLARECNDTWRLMRSLGHNSIYSPRAIRSASGVRRAKAAEMVRFLRSHKAGQVVNLEGVISATFTNIISNILTSKDLFHAGGEGERDGKVRRFLDGLVEKVTSVGVVDLFPVLRGFDIWNKGKAMDIYKQIQLIWHDIITERRAMINEVKSDVTTQDYFDVLNEHGFSDNHISLLLTEQLLGAADSSIITVVWLLSELIKNRDMFHKVRDEIESKAVEDDGTLEESLLSECQYLQASIIETLRLHIPGPFLLPRCAIKTFKVNEFTIPKDSIVVVNAWAIQTSVDNWKDAMRFDPCRFMGWTTKVNSIGTHFRYIPFGMGQRMCPGANVAVTGIQLLVASLVVYFDWSLPGGADPTRLDTADKFGTTLKKVEPLCLIPITRDKYTNL